MRACILIFQHGLTKLSKNQLLNSKYRMKISGGGNGTAQILPMLFMDMTNFLAR